MARSNRKRLSVDLPDTLHNQLSQIARERNITLTRYILRAVITYSLYYDRFEEYEKEIKKFL